jgi:hypothetical protein
MKLFARLPHATPRPPGTDDDNNHSGWDTACIAVTVCGCLSLLCLVPHFIQTLGSLRRLNLPKDDREQGFVGAVFFLWGIVDFCLSCYTSYALFQCEGFMTQANCFLAALIMNYITTIVLVFHTLATIREWRRVSNAVPWNRSSLSSDGGGSTESVTTTSSTTEITLRYRLLLPVVILGAGLGRFQSLAMLRLRLFDKMVFDYPMEDRHMFFLRNAGGPHHIFVADVPCAFISLALIVTAEDNGKTCEGEPIGLAWAMLVCKALLMLYGAASTAVQLLLTGNCGTSISANSHLTDDGVLEVATVASVLRSTAGSLTVSSRRLDRTSLWVDQSAELGTRVGGSE